MKFIIHSSSTQPRASSSLIVATKSMSTIYCQNSSFCSSISRSVCGSCRIFNPKKTALNSPILSIMSSCCISGLESVYHKPHDRRNYSTAVAYSNPSNAPQRSEEWFAIRKDKLTTSTFSTALGFWKGNRRFELWHEKVYAFESEPPKPSQRNAMDWGVLSESSAIDRYKTITGREVDSMSFAVHSEEKFHWLGASPDGIILEDGILEVKCPYNKGKPEQALPWSTSPFYYMPQIQGQMEIMDRDWVDLYCWTPNGSTIFRIGRERGYWELIHGILREFWWENVIPAREALSIGNEEEVKTYIPTSTHKQTGLAIFKSIKMAKEARLICREIAGHVEFYR